MLATVLRGELAEQQSLFIMRAFREMRHYIKQNQSFVTQPEMRLVTAKGRNYKRKGKAGMDQGIFAAQMEQYGLCLRNQEY